jgi:hypothetical protein
MGGVSLTVTGPSHGLSSRGLRGTLYSTQLIKGRLPGRELPECLADNTRSLGGLGMTMMGYRHGDDAPLFYCHPMFANDQQNSMSS